MAYKKQTPRGRDSCRTCQCMRCSCLLCEFDKYYRCYPTNPGCVHCLNTENDTPITNCPNFRFRSVSHVYRIKLIRKNPYYRLAKTLKSLFEQINQI